MSSRCRFIAEPVHRQVGVGAQHERCNADAERPGGWKPGGRVAAGGRLPGRRPGWRESEGREPRGWAGVGRACRELRQAGRRAPTGRAGEGQGY